MISAFTALMSCPLERSSVQHTSRCDEHSTEVCLTNRRFVLGTVVFQVHNKIRLYYKRPTNPNVKFRISASKNKNFNITVMHYSASFICSKYAKSKKI
jgi:hypothetical protein